ncbi:MAG TPA: hypothetical protein VNM69_11690 [Bacillus sp. (in: firmicutes)]|uniref:hypothetical protein n=1 Tax=Bacillus litorisediminis TaxID=2922713 RepID=UPI001FAF5FBE|nr:hypothetical protein [Bacillus litorisediminis]HWO76539.1 hypothetical protein [Bacillus sp. (in: firmicutes)]
MDYKEYWNQIFKESEELNSLIHSYWHQYSHFGTWQFWVVVSLLIIPLILLYFTVDRKRIFEIFFFGYTVHILWTYAGIALERYGYFVHTYFMSPVFPFSINMSASALPVGFLLVYQYCTNQNKNFYIYTLLISAFFAFGVTSIEQYIGLLEFRKGMNHLYIFLIDLVIVLTSYWFTRILLKIKRSVMAADL